jgi:hypothetical protein
VERDRRYIISTTLIPCYKQTQSDLILYDVETEEKTRISVDFAAYGSMIQYGTANNDIIAFVGYEELELADDPDPETEPSGEPIYTIAVECRRFRSCRGGICLPDDLAYKPRYQRWLDCDQVLHTDCCMAWFEVDYLIMAYGMCISMVFRSENIWLAAGRRIRQPGRRFSSHITKVVQVALEGEAIAYVLLNYDDGMATRESKTWKW